MVKRRAGAGAGAVIELFAVPPQEDEAFLAAWRAEAPPGATLHRALRADVPNRFAGFAAGAPDGDGGVLLIVPFEVPTGEEARFRAAWEEVRAVLSTRRGYLGAQLLESPDSRLVAVVHWSSPLMYARAVREEGDLIAALPFPGRPALYLRC
jgi:hypothetical protein